MHKNTQAIGLSITTNRLLKVSVCGYKTNPITADFFFFFCRILLYIKNIAAPSYFCCLLLLVFSHYHFSSNMTVIHFSCTNQISANSFSCQRSPWGFNGWRVNLLLQGPSLYIFFSCDCLYCILPVMVAIAHKLMLFFKIQKSNK